MWMFTFVFFSNLSVFYFTAHIIESARGIFGVITRLAMLKEYRICMPLTVEEVCIIASLIVFG